MARFLPNPDDGGVTHVALLSGHACRVYETSPVDGKKGTDLHPRFQRAASAAGCILIGTELYEEPASTEKTKEEILDEAVEALVEAGNAEDLEASGKPTLAAAKRQAGYTVTRSELDMAWARFVDRMES